MSNLKIGWARRCVSTDKPINIPGQFHMRISRGILDPTMITALTVDSGEDYVIFVSADFVGLYDGFLDALREKAVKINPKLDPLKILISVTHTHCSPSHKCDDAVYGAAHCPHDGVEIASGEEYKDFAISSAAEAVCESYEKRAVGSIAYGYGFAVVAHSRRVVYFDDLSKRAGADNSESGVSVDGHAKMYGDTNDDNFSSYEAGADHFANFMFTFDEKKELTGAIVNIPCPSQNSEMEHLLSADYWNDVRCEISKKYGDIFILPQCAAAGDLSPRILHYKQAQDRRYRLKYDDYDVDERVEYKWEMRTRRDIALRISAAFDEVYSWAKKELISDAPVVHIVETVSLDKRLISDEEYEYCKSELDLLMKQDFKTQGNPEKLLEDNSCLAARRERLQIAMVRYEEQKTEPKLPMEMHVIRIGDIAFASNRFELYMDYQHRIQARSPFTQTFVIQLAGQPGKQPGGSYLATERGALNKGYSATMFCNLVSPEGGQQIVDETVKILKEIY